MEDPVAELAQIYREFGDFSSKRGEVSEEDTRANIIDRILHDVLLWPREAIHRETHVSPGFLDYELSIAHPVVVIEAKAAGKSFAIPYRKGSNSVRLKINGVLRSNEELQAAITQAQRYCIDRGAGYGVVTNGYSFVVFRAIVERESWKNGDAIVFASPKVIESDFRTFSDLLHYEAVRDGKLHEAFRRSAPRQRDFFRPIASIVNADASYERNPINVALRPFVERFFGDIAAQNQMELLEHCYVHSAPLQVIDKDLALIIRDRIPAFAAAADQIQTDDSDQSGAMGDQIRKTVGELPATGMVAVLMGGIGAGKTTFLKRFFQVVAKDLVAEGGPATLIHLDFLGAPDTSDRLEAFLWESLAASLVRTDPTLQERQTLEELGADQIRLMRQVYGADASVCDQKINDALYELVNDPKRFSQKAIRRYRQTGKMPIVAFDNVDQLGVAQQAQIFTTAEFFGHHLGCIAILVMREESYCTAQLQKQLTAYTIRPYHLSSPRFRDMIRVRIDFASNQAFNSEEAETRSDYYRASLREIIDFFRMLRRSVFEKNHNIVRLIEAVSFGNMRLALDLFNNFITSGATNTPEMLSRYRQRGGYTVPFHQFAKSVILGDYRYYKESRSRIINVFDVSPSRNASHFTAMRILAMLADEAARGSGSQGFVDLQRPINALVDAFDNEDDCLRTVTKLCALQRQLVELDTRRTDALDGASSLRITSAGQYYLHFLVRSLAYLDLVWHDTPIANQGVADALSRVIADTNMSRRFERVESFLDYLGNEEREELEGRGLPANQRSAYGPFMPGIRRQYERERKFIVKQFRKAGTPLE